MSSALSAGSSRAQTEPSYVVAALSMKAPPSPFQPVDLHVTSWPLHLPFAKPAWFSYPIWILVSHQDPTRVPSFQQEIQWRVQPSLISSFSEILTSCQHLSHICVWHRFCDFQLYLAALGVILLFSAALLSSQRQEFDLMPPQTFPAILST